MKKLLSVLVALLVVVSMFAAERPFTLGPNVTYTGTVNFSFVVTKDGVDFDGSLTNVSASLAFGPKRDTQAGATFDITYTPFGGVSLTLRTIIFSTPYFVGFYKNDKHFVSHYFTGVDADNQFYGRFKDDFKDTYEFMFPGGLDVYFLDKTSEGTATWFSDMVLVKYPVAGFKIVGGLYNTGETTTHEFGAGVEGALDLGVFKPNLTVFGGMVAKDDFSGMLTAYDVILSGKLEPVTGLTLAPTFKFAENLDKLDYKSTKIVNGKYISLGVTYTTTLAPATLKAQVTPKVDFATATPTTTLKLDELSAKVEVAPVTLFVKTTNDNLLDSSKKYTLYTEASYSDPMLSGSVKAEWADITQLATYTYIHGAVTIKATPELTLYSDVRKIIASTNDFGYNVRAAYAITPNVKLTGFYGTLTTDSNNAYTVINADPTWNVKLTYTASF
jgi:hypothetical protein